MTQTQAAAPRPGAGDAHRIVVRFVAGSRALRAMASHRTVRNSLAVPPPVAIGLK